MEPSEQQTGGHGAVEWMANGAADADPAVGLRAVRALRELADRLEGLQVARARALGWSWQQIAEALAVSRQAVHQKHHSRSRAAPTVVATSPTTPRTGSTAAPTTPTAPHDHRED